VSFSLLDMARRFAPAWPHLLPEELELSSEMIIVNATSRDCEVG